MLNRIDELVKKEVSFAIETTLATKSYQNLIVKAKEMGYETTIVFFWLNSVKLAKERVRFRIKEGGHAIPEEVIERRYYSGLKNFFSIYMNSVTNWQFYDNSKIKQEIIAYADNGEMNILDEIHGEK